MDITSIVDISNVSLRENEIKASQELESYFIHFMLKEMRKTIPKSSLFGKSFAEDIYVDMLDQQIAQNIALSGGIGLSKQISKSLMEKQKIINGYEEVSNIIKS